MNRFTVLVISIIILSVANAATPSWEAPALHNGQIRADGQLHKRFSLGRLNGSPEFNFPVYLEHRISKYPYDEFDKFSQWSVPQLVSYVMPVSGGIFWLSPGGEEYFFKSSDPTYKIHGTKPVKIAASYAAIRSNKKEEADRIQIVSQDRFTYVYDKGTLNYLEAPSGRRLYFRTNGIRIVKMEQRLGSHVVELLSANYDGLNRLTELRIGPIQHTFTYSGDSEMLTSWKPFDLEARQTRFAYKDGMLAEITFPNGRKEVFEWVMTLSDFETGGKHYLPNTKFTPVLKSDSNYLYSFGYDKSEITLQKMNLLGHTDAITFNPITNRLTSIDPEGATTSVVWGRGFGNEATGKLREITSPQGEKLIELDYDSSGRISRMTKRGERPIEYVYDDLDRIVEVRRGDYLPTKYTYAGDSMRPVSITDPVGQTVEFSYGPDQQIVSYKNAINAVQTYTYDEMGRITRRNYPLNVWIAWEYDSVGRITKRTYSNGNSMLFEYDDFSQLKKAVENESVIWEYAYFPSGQLRQLTRNSEVWLQVERELKDGKEYLSLTDNKGAEHERVYSLDGKLLEETNPLKDTIQYKYDPVGQLEGWNAPDGSSVKFEYDSRGKMVFHENHIGQTLERKYDEFGSFVETQTKEQTAKITRDRFGRVTKFDYSNGRVTEIAYDEYGRIAGITSAEVAIKNEYDALDRRLRRMTQHPDGSMFAVVSKYIQTGARASVVNALLRRDGSEAERSVVEYRYDALGRPVEVRINDSSVIRYVYDPKSQMLERKILPNGNQSVYTYDNNGRLEKIESYDPQNNLIGGIGYDWHADGNLIGKRIW